MWLAWWLRSRRAQADQVAAGLPLKNHIFIESHITQFTPLDSHTTHSLSYRFTFRDPCSCITRAVYSPSQFISDSAYHLGKKPCPL